MGMSVGNGGGSGRGRRGRGRSSAPMAEINVTPFVDVMLVLLIIFMVTAPLLVSGVKIDLPESRADALEQEKEPIQISISGDGSIYIDDIPVSAGELPTTFAQMKNDFLAENPPVQSDAQGDAQNTVTSPQIMLRADKGLDYGMVMSVMGELNRAGLNRVSLVTTGSSEPL